MFADPTDHIISSKQESAGTIQSATSTSRDKFKGHRAQKLGYNAVIDKYVIETPAGKELLDSDELYARVNDGLRVQVNGL